MNIEQIYGYADCYQRTVKKAALPAILAPLVPLAAGAATAWGIAATITYFANSMLNQSAKVNELKSHIQHLIGLVDKQKAEGFGKFSNVFEDFQKDAKTVVSLIDDMIKPPAGNNDGTQIQKAQEFVQASQNMMIKSQAVLGALEELQTWSSSVGNFLHGTSLNLGADLTRWYSFSNTLNQINGSLSLVINNVENAIKQSVQVAKSEAPAGGFEGMANVQI